ncbi:MAG: ATP-binding protein [Planctomycetota bacterium]|nr:ATP-binding protein [Planctomycetota bacterium]
MSIPSSEVFEKLASFYLGRQYDLEQSELRDELLMYDAKDLCTHAMCVGMTGSGKTGLCISLLEEAAIDGIPAICVDPKGDLANLLLTFPDLQPTDFKPWLDEGEANRKGVSLDQLAAEKADAWREGLASWGQSPERIAKLRDAADVAIYTPGSNIGLPLTVLKNFDAPAEETRHDNELIGDRVTGAVSGLLTLMGINADPMTSPEHILISSVLRHQWVEGKNVEIGQLIRLIQRPPLKRVGVVDVDSFMSPEDRGKLAMRLNNLLASPAFATWLEGEPLSVKKLLYTPEGKPRISILSIAHLDDKERMFFVTILLNEILAWVRTQRGTSSLRAMFYMDEVAGYFPPVKNPPSKPPMLTLLKQARAFGLGITLATQNPVDLDYKGLSNIGTWFLGRLQTERDKARVLEGLEGASNQVGQPFDRGKMEKILAGLGKRVFLMNNVHDGFTTIFQTRWAMSFLAGPLARGQISRLMEPRKAASKQKSATLEAATGSTSPIEPVVKRPIIPAGVEERFVCADRLPEKEAKLIYRPALYAEGTLHFIRASADLDQWQEVRWFVSVDRGVPPDVWGGGAALAGHVEFQNDPEEGYSFANLPDELTSKSKLRSYRTQFKDYLYRNNCVTLYKSPAAKGYAPVGDEDDALAYFSQCVREQRDAAVEKLRDSYESKLRSLEKKIRTAEDRVSREKSQQRSSMISAASSIAGALLGGFLGGRRTRASTVARGVGYASQQGDDVKRAEDALRAIHDDRVRLDADLAGDLDKLHREFDPSTVVLQPQDIAPRKSDLKVGYAMIVWVPWQIAADGESMPLTEVSDGTR